MAAARPMAVANRASAMAGATTVRLVFCWMAMAWKACMMPQTVPKRPMKGEAVATMASRGRPSSTRAVSRAITESITRSMRWISRAAWVSLVRPLARASRHSRRAACSMRGKAWRGRSPACWAMSSSDRPEETSSSKRSACRLRAVNRSSRSKMTAQENSDASPRPIITAFTTQWARRKSEMKEKLSAVRVAWAAGSIRSGLRWRPGEGVAPGWSETRRWRT